MTSRQNDTPVHLPHSRSLASYFSLLVIASCPVAVIFFIIPFELYYPQRTEWGGEKALPLLFAGVGTLLIPILGIILYGANRCSGKGAQWIASALFFIGIYILCADIFAPLQCSLLDGFFPKSSEPLTMTIRECAIGVGLLGLFLWLGTTRIISHATGITSGIWALSLGYLLVVAQSDIETKVRISPPTRSDLKNIYHIVLDELQTDVALAVIKDLHLEKSVRGFTVFPFNSSSYLFTKASFPNYMTGTTYKAGENFQEWLNTPSRKGILKELSERGYEIAMNAPMRAWDNDYVTRFRDLDEVMQDSLQLRFPGFGDFFPVWFARLLPNPLTNEALSLGHGLERKLSRKIEKNGYFPRSINEGREPYASVLMLKDAIKRERTLSPTGRYTYLHAILPHGPYVMDGTCRFTRQLPPARVRSYYQQAVCGIRLVRSFLRELKRLKRYDNSIIILHADTGHGLRGLIQIEENTILSSEENSETPRSERKGTYPDWNERQLFARTLSFLSVKPAGASSPLAYSRKNSQLLDLYPTVMSMIGAPSSPDTTEGTSLLLSDEIFPHRESSFFLFDPRDKAPVMTTYRWDAERAHIHMTSLLGELENGGTR